MRARIIQTIIIVGAVVLGSLGAAILLGVRLQRIISAPILRLAQATQTISAQGDYSVRVEKGSRDESDTTDARNTASHRVFAVSGVFQ